MALQPDISLKAGGAPVAFDPVGSAAKGLSLRQLMNTVNAQPQMIQADLAAKAQALAASKTAQKAQEVQTAGALTKNEQDARELASKKYWAANAKNHLTPDGKVNYEAMARQGALDGQDPETIFNLLDRTIATKQTQFKNAAERKLTGDSIMNIANTMMYSQKDPQRAAAIAAAAVQRAGRVLGEEEAKEAANQFWNMPSNISMGQDGKPDMIQLGTHLQNQAIANQNSTRTPQQLIDEELARTQIGQTAETIAQAGKGSGTGAEERSDTSGPNAIAIRKQITDADPSVANIVANMSVADMKQRYGNLIAENVVPGSLKASGVIGSVKKEEEAQALDHLNSAASKLKGKYPKLTVGVIIAKKFDTALLNDPDVREFVTLVEKAKAAGLPLADNAGPDSVSQIAAGEAKTLRKQGATMGARTSAPTFSRSDDIPGAPNSAKDLEPKGNFGGFASTPAEKDQEAIWTGALKETQDALKKENNVAGRHRLEQDIKAIKAEMKKAGMKVPEASAAQEKMVSVARISDGVIRQVPADVAEKLIASKKFKRGSK